MKRSVFALLLGGGVAASAAALLACNAVLGIGAATLDSDSGANVEGGTGDDGGQPGRALSCDYYCRTVEQNCTGNNNEFEGTEDAGAICQTVCAGYDVGHTGTIGASDDDTLGCRIFYAEKAAADPATNCRFAGPAGGGKCGNNPCQLFCALTLQYCVSPPLSATPCSDTVTSACTPYASVTDCLQACQGDGGYQYILSGSDLLDNGDSLNCRVYHLENALGSTPSLQFHCPHTAKVSAVCNGDGGM
jgi:hypothetical protein